MAWVVVDLHGTLLQEDDVNGASAILGAPEAMGQLLNEGHRVTVYTSVFAPMPESRRNELKQNVVQTLYELGFPAEQMEVWTGTTKPDGDVFIGDNHITFDQDWGLALAQMQQMLEERGLVPGALEAAAGPDGELDGESEMAAEEPDAFAGGDNPAAPLEE